jgi:hypothetical protein
LDTVLGLGKTVDDFDIYFGGQGGFDISKCVLQRTHEEICVFRDGMYLSRLVAK